MAGFILLSPPNSEPIPIHRLMFSTGRAAVLLASQEHEPATSGTENREMLEQLVADAAVGYCDRASFSVEKAMFHCAA